jgi:hypothetical protein
MNITSLTPGQLRKAADIQERILKLQNVLQGLLGGETPEPTVQPPRKRRRLSAKAIANIRAGARNRRTMETSGVAGAKRKRRMSAAAKRAQSLRMKARWAKAKAAGKATL